MYWNEAHHARLHFHARYGGQAASIALDGNLIAGSLPGGVEGSNPFSRSREGPHFAGLFLGAAGWCDCVAGYPMGTGGQPGPCQRSDDRLRSARGTAQRPSPSSRGSDHAGRPVHRRVRPRPATQAAHGVRGDPAKPAPAPRLSDHRWRGRRERSPQLRGRWGLVDAIENADGVWMTLADGLGNSTRAAASRAVTLGALRASRRSGGDISEALVVMHQTFREMPGPRAEMAAVVARWEPASAELRVANCGHVAPVILRNGGEVEHMRIPMSHGLGGRASAKPVEQKAFLAPGDRLVMVSDGVTAADEGPAALGDEGVVQAALRSRRGTAADTVRKSTKRFLPRPSESSPTMSRLSASPSSEACCPRQRWAIFSVRGPLRAGNGRSSQRLATHGGSDTRSGVALRRQRGGQCASRRRGRRPGARSSSARVGRSR
jgi:Stage II sporulation protein E (SpoIIE)/Domain of unknown function (DUF4160)